MTLYYSKETNGFYDDEIHTTIPSDSVVITRGEHTALLTGQSEGKVISSDANGRPVATAPAKPALGDYKRTARASVDTLRKNKETEGMSYVFPDESTDVVQLRNTRDLVNITSLVTSAQLLKSAGFTGVIPFQAESNTTHAMTADQIIQMGLDVGSYIQSLYAVAWPIKAAIDAAEDYDAVDAAAIWPE